MNKIRVNGKHVFELSLEENKPDPKFGSLSIQDISANYIHVLYKNKSFRVEVIKHNLTLKELTLKVNAREYLVETTDEYDQLLHKLGLDRSISSQITEVKAPMPGLVLKILVNEGDTVMKGDNLIILEAMKMENIIKSPTDGAVNTILVSIGNKLEKNQSMIKFQ